MRCPNVRRPLGGGRSGSSGYAAQSTALPRRDRRRDRWYDRVIPSRTHLCHTQRVMKTILLATLLLLISVSASTVAQEATDSTPTSTGTTPTGPLPGHSYHGEV